MANGQWRQILRWDCTPAAQTGKRGREDQDSRGHESTRRPAEESIGAWSSTRLEHYQQQTCTLKSEGEGCVSISRRLPPLLAVVCPCAAAIHFSWLLMPFFHGARRRSLDRSSSGAGGILLSLYHWRKTSCIYPMSRRHQSVYNVLSPAAHSLSHLVFQTSLYINSIITIVWLHIYMHDPGRLINPCHFVPCSTGRHGLTCVLLGTCHV